MRGVVDGSSKIAACFTRFSGEQKICGWRWRVFIELEVKEFGLGVGDAAVIS